MIGILSDAHGNRPAFEAAIERLTHEGARRFVFLGDAVGYIPTVSVLEAIRDMGQALVCVRGNHEDMVLSNRLDPVREAVYQHERTRVQLDAADVSLMTSWPTERSSRCPAGDALFIHGSPHDPTWGYVYPDTDLASFDVEEAFVFMGHTHRPFIRQHGRTVYINVGSCGLPRDRPGVGAAALFDDTRGTVRIVRFPIEEGSRSVLVSVPGVHASVASLLRQETSD